METSKKKLRFQVKLASTAQYVKFFSGAYSLTDKEIVILSHLIDNTHVEICDKENRSLAAVSLGISKMVLNTYIKRLKDKKALRFKDGSYELSKIFQRHGTVEIIIHGET